jgi:hypothetical protein
MYDANKEGNDTKPAGAKADKVKLKEDLEIVEVNVIKMKIRKLE